MDIRTLAAQTIGCQPEQLLGFSRISEKSYKAIGPDGKTYLLTIGDLQQTAARLTLGQASALQHTIDEILPGNTDRRAGRGAPAAPPKQAEGPVTKGGRARSTGKKPAKKPANRQPSTANRKPK